MRKHILISVAPTPSNYANTAKGGATLNSAAGALVYSNCSWDVQRPYLSVVIPVGRLDPSLACCIQALSRQTLAKEEFEVVLSLDGVALESDFIARLNPTFPLRVYGSDSCTGRARCRNRGLARARGRVAVSIDCDMIASPDVLSEHFRAHQHAPVAGIGVSRFVQPFNGMNALTDQGFSSILAACLPRDDYRKVFYEATDYLRRAAEPFWAFATSHCSYPLDLARQVGCFDEQFRGWGLEDQEFGYRLWRTRQLRFVHLPNAVAIHVDHDRNSQTDRDTWLANRSYCVQKHGPLFANPLRQMRLPQLLPIDCSD
jgi:glycosyltransferase involved in cell wall biosynthesis